MKEACITIKDMYSQFFDGGAYIILFLISLIYIFLFNKEKNSHIKIFLWYSIILWMIILNPIVYKILEPILTGGVYWRLFWMLPISITIPYMATKIVTKTDEKETCEVSNRKLLYTQIKKSVIFIAIIVIICMSGKFVFNKETYTTKSDIIFVVI